MFPIFPRERLKLTVRVYAMLGLEPGSIALGPVFAAVGRVSKLFFPPPPHHCGTLTQLA